MATFRQDCYHTQSSFQCQQRFLHKRVSIAQVFNFHAYFLGCLNTTLCSIWANLYAQSELISMLNHEKIYRWSKMRLNPSNSLKNILNFSMNRAIWYTHLLDLVVFLEKQRYFKLILESRICLWNLEIFSRSTVFGLPIPLRQMRVLILEYWALLRLEFKSSIGSPEDLRET